MSTTAAAAAATPPRPLPPGGAPSRHAAAAHPASGVGGSGSSGQHAQHHSIGGFGGAAMHEEIPSGGHGDGERPPQDVNVAHVIENPREQTSLLNDLIHIGWRSQTPTAPLSVLPEITRRDFAGYMSQLRAVRVRMGLSSQEAAALFTDHEAAATAAAASSSRQKHAQAAVALAAPLLPPMSPTMAQLYTRLGGSGAGGGGAPGNLTVIAGAAYIDAFKVVPPKYFDAAFDSQHSAALAAVIAGSPSLDDAQELMTGYLDVVECQLLALIKSRSRQFFEALHDLQELQQRVTAANDTATSLVDRVARIKLAAAEKPLYVVHGSRRLSRGAALRAMLHTVNEALQATARAGKLISADDMMGALSVINATRGLIIARLDRVTAAAGLLRQLDDFERLVGDTLVSRYAAQAVALAVVGAAAALPAPGGSPLERSGSTGSQGGSGGGGSDGGLMSPMKASNPPLNLEAFLAGVVVPAASGRRQNASATLAAAAAAVTADSLALEEVLQASVRPTLEGLSATGRLGGALEAFQAALLLELKMCVRSETSEALAAAEQAEGGGGGGGASSQPPLGSTAVGHTVAAADTTPQRMAALSPAEFMAVLAAVCRALLDVLRRVHALHELVESVLDAAAATPALHPPSPAAAEDAPPAPGNRAPRPAHAGVASTVASAGRLRALSSGVMGVAVDAAQRHVVRLLALRRDPGVPVRVSDMKRLWDTGAAFSAAAHSLLARVGGAGAGGPGTGGTPIQEECLLHARSMLGAAHARNVRTLGAVLEAETWTQADVPSPVQALADAISASGAAVLYRSGGEAAGSGGGGGPWGPSRGGSAAGARGGPAASSSSPLVAAAAAALDSVPPPPNSSLAPSLPSAAAAPASSRSLVVRGQPFFVVGAAIMLVRMLGDYSALADAIPDVAADVIRCAVDLLRTFNRRATELVLGAGAMQTANLRRITAKHLALTAQSLGAVLALLPSVRAALIMRLPPHQHIMLSELARVTADFMQHEQAILAKFVEIVKELLVKCVEDMRPLRWGDPDTPFTVPSAPTRELVRGVSTLHKILEPVLRGDQLGDVFSRVAVMVGGQVPLQYTVLLAHLTDAAAQASIQAASAPLGTSAPGGDGGAPAPSSPAPPFARFSRHVANERLAADVNVFIAAMAQLAESTSSAQSPAGAGSGFGHGGGTGGEPGQGGMPAEDGEFSSGSSLSAGAAAMQSLRVWTQRMFGAGSVVVDESPVAAAEAEGDVGGGGGEAAAVVPGTPVQPLASDEAAERGGGVVPTDDGAEAGPLAVGAGDDTPLEGKPDSGVYKPTAEEFPPPGDATGAEVAVKDGDDAVAVVATVGDGGAAVADDTSAGEEGDAGALDIIATGTAGAQLAEGVR